MWNRLKASLAPAPPPVPPKTQPAAQQAYTPQERASKALSHAAAHEFTASLALLLPLGPLFSPTGPSSSPSSVDSSSSPHPYELTQEEKVKLAHQLEDLNQLIRRKLEEIMRADDHIVVCHACRILSFLQSIQPNPPTENEGLDIYLDFLEKIIHKDATEFMKLLVEESDTTTSAAVLADLFSLTGSIVHDALPLVSHFSSDGVHKLVSRAHHQCSLHVTNIFELFSEELNLADTVQQIQSYRNVPVEAVSPLISNPLQLDETLQTISLMCAYATRYIMFIQGKDALVDCSNLQASIQVMLGNYLALESFYLEHALNEAITSQQAILIAKANQDIAMQAASAAANALSVPNNNSPSSYSQSNLYGNPSNNVTRHETTAEESESIPQSSTQVDDAFFILKKILKRGLSTLAANVACAIINSASMALEMPYFSSLHTICDQLASQPTDVFLEILNDLELSSEYIVKLDRELTGDIERLFTAAAEKTKLKACLDDMTKSASSTCNKLRKKNLSLYGDKLIIKMDAMFTALFRPINYDLDENTYEQAEINDPFVQRLLQDLQDRIKPASNGLRQLNRSDLALMLASAISSKFESAVLTKRFTSLGAVQLSKEVRLLGDFFVALGGQPLRYQFTKLAQISQLLNLDRVIDCMEYWIEGKSVFKLGADEVRLVLARRLDFTAESINALKL